MYMALSMPTRLEILIKGGRLVDICSDFLVEKSIGSERERW
jgi:hypothetical protein